MLRNDVFGLIYASEDNYNLRELVSERSVAALPIGGRYRAIDYTLSNMVETGIRNVGVITLKNYKSLMDHLGSGKEWDLARKNHGLVLMPPYDTVSNRGIYQGMCDAVYSKLDFLHRAPQEYCLLSGSYTIYSTLYSGMFEEHIKNNADITVMYSTEDKKSDEAVCDDVRLYTDENGRVVDIEYESKFSKSNKLGMDVYLMHKTLLETLVQGACARGKYDFVTDVLIPNIKKLKIYAVPHKGYVGRLTSVNDYFNINMDMLKKDVQRDLFASGHPVHTRIKDEPPVIYKSNAQVENSVFGDGCTVDGTVQNCVIFRGVSIGRGAVLKNCIIMQECSIGEGCELTNVIIDKFARINHGVRLMGAPGFPVIIRKEAVI